MKIALTMPQFGESITQSRIIRWLKKEGEAVTEGEPLVEMETEKSVFSYESPFQGTLSKVLEAEEKEVPVGTPIAQFEVSDADAKKYESLGVGQTVAAGSEPAKTETPKAVASPAAPPTTAAGVKRIPISPIRARIAENMVLSKQKIPHAGTGIEVDMSGILAWRKAQSNPPGVIQFIIWSTIKALKEHSNINAAWKESGPGSGDRWIEQYDYINLGVAVATEQGLMVPVIRNAHQMSFGEAGKEFNRLVAGAREGKLTPQEMTGATFTLNNPGSVGAIRTQQIVPPTQSAIMAINRIVQRPWAVVLKDGSADGKVEVRPIMNLDVAFDHRLIDGEHAIRFVVSVEKNLENFDFGIVS